MDGDGLALAPPHHAVDLRRGADDGRAGEEIGVNLAVSLHAVTKDVRDEMVPINRNMASRSCSKACADYPGANNARRITFEYVMLKDINDSDDDARELVRLLTANTIARQGQSDPVQSLAGRAYECSSPERIRASRNIVFEGGHIGAGAHAARARHHGRLRSAENVGREEEAGRPRSRGGGARCGYGGGMMMRVRRG
jgi:23S rRNA (adenine2503-C2)-methyltransferase